MKKVEDYIITIPDFPQPGIMFRDITGVLEDADGLKLAVDELVKLLDGLLVDFCRKEKCKVVIRGVRVYSDFEYEFQMALTNRRMAPEIETLFMMPSENLAYVTASTVREIASYGGDTAPFVTAAVPRRLAARHG